MLTLLLTVTALGLGQGEKPRPYAQQAPLALRSAAPNRATVPRFEKFELTLDLSATYDNPFDPEDIAVWADLTSPQGGRVRINGFLDRPYTRRLEGDTERLEPAGEPVWRIRFAPDAVGTWRYRVHAKDRTGTVSLPEARFRATSSSNPGFVRRSRRNPAVFAFEGERPFFAVGENMGWGGKRGSYDYDDWLAALGRAGGNWIRIWMSSWNCALEWSREPQGEWRSGTYHGVGVYSLENAWKLDTILDTAEKHGIYVMLCFGTYGEFTTGGFFGEGQWKANPYNVANGGPCARPEEFWTNAQARRLYRQRLRYIAARYGHRTSIHSWEFWNETNPPAAWVGEMARYMKGRGEFAGQPADPYGHLVTTSYGSDAIWRLPEIDITQTHHYGMGNVADHAPVVHNDARSHAVYGKPHLMAEFGIDWRKSDIEYDPEGRGVNLHNGLWASAMAGNAGGAMIWWWDNYIHPKNLYAPFGALRRFADAVPWTDGEWKPLTTDAPVAKRGPETWTDLVLPATSGWGRSGDTEFILQPGGVAGSKALPQFLYGPAKVDLRTTPTFRVKFDRPGRFVVRVETVSDRGRLRLLLDGKPVLDQTLSAVPPQDPAVKPEYEATEFKPEYGIYQARFQREYGIEVPAGEHRITVENAEGDWLSIGGLTLTGYRSSRYPALNLYGLTNGKEAILWAQNAQHYWKNLFEKKPILPITGAETVVRGLPAGRYTVEWWDTWQGKVVSREVAESRDGALTLRLPDISTDMAARIHANGPQRRGLSSGALSQ